MTGILIRVRREGRWQNLDIDELTDDELDTVALEQPGRGWFWGKGLARWIRDNVRETTVPIGEERSTGKVEHCPNCQAPLDAYVGVGNDIDIKDGGRRFVLCGNCGSWLKYENDAMRLINERERLMILGRPEFKDAAEQVVARFQGRLRPETN